MRTKVRNAKRTGKSSDLDALLFGLDIENRSYDLYRRAASETTNAEGKAMFEFLAEEERGHPLPGTLAAVQV